MQLSEKSRKTVDACRFCWMCRHICPIGNATGQERNTARARALSLSMVVRGSAELSDVVDNLYECALCGGCTKECATGWDPVLFTKEARLAAAMEGVMPEYIEKLITNLEKTGNVYGKKTLDKKLKAEIETLPEKAEVLLFLGSDARCNAPANAIEAIELLKKAGVNFTVMKNEPDSGYSYDFLLGAAAETREAMENAAAAIKSTGAKKVVAYDPADAKVFMREYKEWNIALSAKPVTFTAFVNELITDKKLKIKKTKDEFVFQDPAHLARDLEETKPARNILSALGKTGEMLMSGRDTMIAGHPVMKAYMPDVMKLVAERRMADALHVGTKKLVTASPAEYLALAALKEKGIEIMTLEEAVIKCL